MQGRKLSEYTGEGAILAHQTSQQAVWPANNVPVDRDQAPIEDTANSNEFGGVSRLLLAQFTPLIGGDTHAQRVQLDKSFSVFLIVSAAIVFKCGDIFVEQTICRAATHQMHTAFV